MRESCGHVDSSISIKISSMSSMRTNINAMVRVIQWCEIYEGSGIWCGICNSANEITTLLDPTTPATQYAFFLPNYQLKILKTTIF